MLTVCGFIEQENWTYAADYRDRPAYRNKPITGFTSIAVDEYWQDGGGGGEETNEYLLSLPEIYKGHEIKRKIKERQEKIRLRWLRDQWHINAHRKREKKKRHDEGKLQRMWLRALDRHMMYVEIFAHRLNTARPSKLEREKRLAEIAAYREDRERRRTALLVLMEERKKRIDAINLQGWEERLRCLIEQTRRD